MKVTMYHGTKYSFTRYRKYYSYEYVLPVRLPCSPFLSLSNRTKASLMSLFWASIQCSSCVTAMFFCSVYSAPPCAKSFLFTASLGPALPVAWSDSPRGAQPSAAFSRGCVIFCPANVRSRASTCKYRQLTSQYCTSPGFLVGNVLVRCAPDKVWHGCV